MSHRRRRGDRLPRRRPPKGVTPPLPRVEITGPAPEEAAASAARAEEASAPPQPPAPTRGARNDVWLVLALLALAAVSFLPALSNGFVWEDNALVVDNPLVRDPSSIGAIFGRPFLPARPNSYHPLVTLTYLMDFQVWRLNPQGYHSANLTLHLIATLLVFAMATQLLRRRTMAFAAGAVFAVHPVHVQSVAWIAGRPELLATCLALFAVLAYSSYINSFAAEHVSSNRRAAYYAVSLIAFTLALFAHAAAGALIILLPLYEIMLARQRLDATPRRRCLLPYVGFAAGIMLYLLARWWALGYNLAVGFDVREWPAYLCTAPLWAVRAVELMLLPVFSQPYYLVQVVASPLRADVLTAAAAMAVAAALAWRLNIVSAAASFALWWALLTLAPALSLLPVPSLHFDERDLYLPSVGIALAAGWAVIRIQDSAVAQRRRWVRGIVIGVFAAAVAVGMTVSLVRAGWYRDEVALFTRMARSEPRLALPHFNLGNAHLYRGETERAIRQYKLALGHRPSAAVYHNLGNAYMIEERYAEAAEAYRRALELSPSSGTASALEEALQRRREKERPPGGLGGG